MIIKYNDKYYKVNTVQQAVKLVLEKGRRLR